MFEKRLWRVMRNGADELKVLELVHLGGRKICGEGHLLCTTGFVCVAPSRSLRSLWETLVLLALLLQIDSGVILVFF